MKRYVALVSPLTLNALFMSMPRSRQDAVTTSVNSSSPRAVRKLTFISRRDILWAMFLPTPPMDMLTFPGLESLGTRGLYGIPPISLLRPPTTTV